MKTRLSIIISVFFSIQAFCAAEPKFLIEEDPSLLTTVVDVVVQTGAVDDAPTKSGLTNLLAELMLRGTKTKNRSKFQNEVESLGASLDVRTTSDLIVFEGRVIQENTKAFLKLLEDAIVRPAFVPAEFQSLKTEVIASIANKKNQNGRLAGLAMRRHIFANTTLEHQVDGGMNTLTGITLDDVQKAYNDRFHQGNLLFAITSPVKSDEVKATLSAAWRQLPDGLKISRRSLPLKVPRKPLLIVVNKPGTSTGSLLQGQSGVTAQDPDRYALQLGNYSFGGDIQLSRLFHVIREELGWTYAIGSTYSAMGELTYQQGIYVISYTPSIEFTVKSLLKTLSMWKDYYQAGLKKEELISARESLVNSYPFEFDSAEKRLSHRLHSYLYNVPVLSPEDYEKKLKSISNDEIVKVLKAKQSPEGWIVAVVADPKEIQKQLDAEQKEVPEGERLKIGKVMTPDEVIQ